MSLETLRRQLPRNFWLASVSGLILTYLAAFAARFSHYGWVLLRYGIDGPFSPQACVISNCFWIFAVLCMISVFRRSELARTEAMPSFLLTAQVFAGELFTILLAGVWHSLLIHRWSQDLPPVSTIEIIVETIVGQVLAAARRVLFPLHSAFRDAGPSFLP